MKNRLLEEQNEKISTLCDAAVHNERQFWKLVKGKRHKSQLSTFLINERFVSDLSEIMKMWFTHFASLGHAHSNSNYDSNFEWFVRNFTENETENFCALNCDSTGLFDAPPSREEVYLICNSLPKGSSRGYDQIIYEHVLYSGPALSDVIYDLFLRFFYDNGSPEMLKICMMLPLFKGKGLKAYDIDNYRGIPMFPVITKIFEMILLKRLEDLARSTSYFLPLQFGFKMSVGCLEASFVISESVNHKLEHSNKVFSCFLDVKKAFDTVWLDGLLFTLLNDLGVCGKMWLILKDLYTEVQGFVTYGGSTPGLFSIDQGSGQGRIVAPFLYKVFANDNQETINNDPFSLSIENIPVGCPTFADDLTLLALFPSFLQHLMSIVFDFLIKWR